MVLDNSMEQFFFKVLSTISNIGISTAHKTKSGLTGEIFYIWTEGFSQLGWKTMVELLSSEHSLVIEQVSFEKDDRGCWEINNSHVLIPRSPLIIYEWKSQSH